MGSKLCETFAFDNLDRIDYSQRNGVTNVDVAYDALGNVTSKSDVGSYTYDATKIHAVTAAGSNSYAYDANGNMTSRNGSTVNWFSYDLPMRIYAPGSVTYLQYGPDRSLWRQEATTSGVTETTTYVGDVVEKVSKDGVTTWKHYVEAPTGTAAVYLRRSSGTPAAETYYLTHDHLGSTDKVLDAAGGVVTVAESFTALGARRGSTWQGTPTPAELAAIAATTRDGFTGHETLDSVGLVHMGGRVYDPVIGRFLSVDPVVRDIGAAQSWNSYGYVEGRVVSWIDPTGFWGCSPNSHPAWDYVGSANCLEEFIATGARILMPGVSGYSGDFYDIGAAAADLAGAASLASNFAAAGGLAEVTIVNGLETVTVTGTTGEPDKFVDSLFAPWGGWSGFAFGLNCIFTCDWPGAGWDASLAGIPVVPVGVEGAVAGAIGFKTGHYAPRLIKRGIDVARAEAAVATALASNAPGLAVGSRVGERFMLDGVMLAYRAERLADGSINVGTIHVVYVKP